MVSSFQVNVKVNAFRQVAFLQFKRCNSFGQKLLNSNPMIFAYICNSGLVSTRCASMDKGSSMPFGGLAASLRVLEKQHQRTCE